MGQYGRMEPRFLQVGSVKTKPRQINLCFLFLRLSLGYCQKSGFTTKPRRRNKFIATFIYSSEFRILPKKTFQKLNLADGIFCSGDLFLRLSLGFCRKTGFKPKPRRRSKCFGDLFLAMRLRYPI